MPERNTSRVTQLHEKAFEVNEKKILDDLGSHPCSVVQVREEGGVPGWSYTVGLFDTCGQPEVIVIGLKEDLALSLLNHIARLFVEGKRFESGHRERGLLSTVECEFRDVEKRWLRHVMGYAIWFYQGDSFPVLQCVYPDMENRFSWDEGSTAKWRERQPLLFSSSLSSAVETDFWAGKSPLPPHLDMITAKQIMSGDEPITSVYHDTDDDDIRQFLGPSEPEREDCVFVCLHHVMDKDRTLESLSDLPPGWSARRDGPSEPWIREVTPPEKGE